MDDSEIEARIKRGNKASGVIAGLSVLLFAIPIVFVVGVYLFWYFSMSLMD